MTNNNLGYFVQFILRVSVINEFDKIQQQLLYPKLLFVIVIFHNFWFIINNVGTIPYQRDLPIVALRQKPFLRSNSARSKRKNLE